MIRRALIAAAALAAMAAAAGCGLVTSTNRSVFFVFDVSGTYVKSVPDAAKFANLTVSELEPGDWVGASQISACSFSEKEIVLQRQLPTTPSQASTAKRELFDQLNTYAGQVKSAKYTDIRGALAQAAFELKQRPESERFIVLFSDMVGDYAKACDTSHIDLDLKGIHVIAANVIKTNPADPQKYFDLLKEWEASVVAAGGTWDLVASPDQLPKLIVDGAGA
jgi:hypothetical protein